MNVFWRGRRCAVIGEDKRHYVVQWTAVEWCWNYETYWDNGTGDSFTPGTAPGWDRRRDGTGQLEDIVLRSRVRKRRCIPIEDDL